VTGLLQHRRQEWNGKGSSNLEEWGGGENIRPGQRRHSMGHACVLLLRQAGGVTLAGGSGAQQQAHQRAQIKWHELGADRRG
jgi:hypothetical protein